MRAGARRGDGAPAAGTPPAATRRVKLAFVVQRYGAEIAGGSEAHCRELAKRLSPVHEITILTTCARDYVTWNNVDPAGESPDGAVRVIRFLSGSPGA